MSEATFINIVDLVSVFSASLKQRLEGLGNRGGRESEGKGIRGYIVYRQGRGV